MSEKTNTFSKMGFDSELQKARIDFLTKPDMGAVTMSEKTLEDSAHEILRAIVPFIGLIKDAHNAYQLEMAIAGKLQGIISRTRATDPVKEEMVEHLKDYLEELEKIPAGLDLTKGSVKNLILAYENEKKQYIKNL